MADTCVLGVDCGTQSLRAAVYRADGTQLAQASRPYPTRCARVNWAEQDPRDWWDALCGAVPDCLARAGVSGRDVAAIACDGTSFTGVFCREDGTPLRPAILWMDLRAAEEARRVEATQHAVLDYCGRHISAEWLLPKALWVRDHEPEVFDEAARIVEGADWLVHRLTGRWVTSTGNAAGKRHWTPDGRWPEDLYEAVGLDGLARKSPDEVRYVGEPAGALLSDAAAALGLSADCIVAHAGMDGWTAPIGKDCFAPGCASLTLGTSTVVIVETDKPALIDGAMGPFPEGIRRGYSVYEAGQTSGGSTIGWYLGLVGAANDAAAYARLEEEARRIPPGAEGLVVFDAWRGNRTPYFDPGARGVIAGLTLEHSPAHLYRAILEGCALAVRNVLETLAGGGRAVREIRACGTGAGNGLWVDIIATATGCPILVSHEKQATCLGSAICAAVACGAHEDLESAAAAMATPFETVTPSSGIDVYDGLFESYLETYRQVRPIVARLSQPKGEQAS
ncbi:MAG: xylulose kinase [Candidatus Hydrogenedentes bacterium]|nr:xylulose kinase [Candidatus Hydrogenedentota bacterium]